MGDFTRLLREVADGNKEALDELMPQAEEELRARANRLMQGERGDHTLQPTALVNEMYIRLVEQKEIDCKGRSHFLAVASKKMREILKSHARDRKAQKRGGDWAKVPLDEGILIGKDRCLDVVALDAALEEVEWLDKRLAEIVQMRLLGGMELKEIAEVLKISTKTVQRDLTAATVILLKELAGENDD